VQVCISLQTDNDASTPPLSFLQAGCTSCCPTNSVKALKAHRKHRKLKPGLFVFYDFRPGNGVGLFSKEKISMGGDKKKVKKKEKWRSIRYKQANNIYSAENKD